MSIAKRLGAEFIGTFWLVLGGCGSAVLAAAFPSLGIGFAGVALAFGLTVLTMAFAIGHVSGCHLNPAVSFGLWAGGRFPGSDLAPYIIAQVVGACAACGVFSLVGHTGANFAANGYGELSMLKASLSQVFILETVLTAFFILVIMGVTRPNGPSLLAPLAIGLTLTAIHLMAIPNSNASVNPARSFGSAIYAGAEALSQVWVFWAAPILGGVIGGLFGRWLLED